MHTFAKGCGLATPAECRVPVCHVGEGLTLLHDHCHQSCERAASLPAAPTLRQAGSSAESAGSLSMQHCRAFHLVLHLVFNRTNRPVAACLKWAPGPSLCSSYARCRPAARPFCAAAGVVRAKIACRLGCRAARRPLCPFGAAAARSARSAASVASAASAKARGARAPTIWTSGGSPPDRWI